ncbi:MAG: DUF86 domain-containing protein [Flavobacteriales bacterium]
MAVRRSNTVDPLLPIYVQEMMEAVKHILGYTNSISLHEFVNNKMLCDAVQHQFEILGEASSHVPHALQKRYKQIPWSMMYSLRNHIAHEYFDVDYEIIWEIVQHDLPKDLANLNELYRHLT